jgi:IS605 OrfB family transposase
MILMKLIESHTVNKSRELDELTFKTKNLYNAVNYIIRQEFINNGNWLRKFYLFNISKNLEEYKVLPTRVSRCVIRTLDANWKSFFEANKTYNQNKLLFKERPRLPRYLDKKGKFTAIFIDNGILIKKKNEGLIGLSSLKQQIKLKNINKKIIEIQIIPYYGKYKLNVVYEEPDIKLKSNNNNYCSIDLGVNNLMTITSNKIGIKPIIINGRPLKSINQYYNKKLAKLKSLNAKKQIEKLSLKRTNNINTYLHQGSRYLIDFCVKNELNTIIVGHNINWKQESNMSKIGNQNFINIPFDNLVRMIQYKGLLKGITVLYQEESYTSKASFLNLDYMPVYGDLYKGNFSGYRYCRGMYKIRGKKIFINADVNGSYNILRKAVPNVFNNGIEGVAVHPNLVVTLN